MEENTFRVLLDFSKLNKYSHNLIWTSVLPRETYTIREFKQMLVKKFNLTSDNINIFMQGGLLLEDEPIFILKQNDIIRLEYCGAAKNNTSFLFHNNSIRDIEDISTEPLNQIDCINGGEQKAVPPCSDVNAYKKKPKKKHHKRKHDEVISPECVNNLKEKKKRKKHEHNVNFTPTPHGMEHESNELPRHEVDNVGITLDLQKELDISEKSSEESNQLGNVRVTKILDVKSNKIKKSKSMLGSQIYATFPDVKLSTIVNDKNESSTLFNEDSKEEKDTIFDHSKSSIADLTKSLKGKDCEKKKRKRKKKRKVPLIILPTTDADENLFKLNSPGNVSKTIPENNEFAKHVYYSTTSSNSPTTNNAKTFEESQLNSMNKNENSAYSCNQSQKVNSTADVTSNDSTKWFSCDSSIAVQASSNNIYKSREETASSKYCTPSKISPAHVRNIVSRLENIARNEYSKEIEPKNENVLVKNPSRFNGHYGPEKEHSTAAVIPVKDIHLRSRPTSIACHHPEMDLETDDFQENFMEYPVLQSLPIVGTCIAFKSLELDDSYCPVVSEYKKGVIEHIDPNTEELTIKLCIPEIKTKKNVKFENVYDHEQPCVEEIQYITSTWTALIEPRLVE